MKLSHTTLIENIPRNIRTKMLKANIFYSLAYEKYIYEDGDIPVYIYDEKFVLLFKIHKIYMFKTAILPSEPICLTEYNCDYTDFLNKAILILNKHYKVEWISPNLATSLFSYVPSNSINIPFGSHVINLNEAEENIWSNIHSKHKNSIRNAEKNNIRIVFGGMELLDDYIKLDCQTWERSNKRGFQSSFYEKYLLNLNNNCIIAIA
ncbi:MAG: hypothetical protein ACD_4C00288G0001, partial [uncultured bacterium (gcode 4)]